MLLVIMSIMQVVLKQSDIVILLLCHLFHLSLTEFAIKFEILYLSKR